MIRKINSQDMAVLKTFAYRSPDINLFLIGDIENVGLDSDCLDVWGFFEDETLAGVLLRYFQTFCIFDPFLRMPTEAFIKIIREFDIQSISGEAAVIERFAPYFEYKKIDKSVYCRLDGFDVRQDVDVSDIKTAVPNDAKRICALIDTIREFGKFAEEEIRQKIASKAGRVYYIENEAGEMVSIAQTAAENSVSAMVIGVCTRTEYRKKGLMRRLVIKLCDDLIKENKRPCLFYSNPIAGGFYARLGFMPIGKWTMLKF